MEWGKIAVCQSLCIICNVRLRKPPEAGSGPFLSQETNLALKHKNVYKKGVELDSSHHWKNPSSRPCPRLSGPFCIKVKVLKRTPLAGVSYFSCNSVSSHLCSVTLWVLIALARYEEISITIICSDYSAQRCQVRMEQRPWQSLLPCTDEWL